MGKLFNSLIFVVGIAMVFSYFKVTHPLVGLTIPQLLSKYGFPGETHTIQTQDGYLLTFYRIPCGRNPKECNTTNRPPVFFMHGMSSSSADWMVRGPNKSLGLLLADKGYDVWLGNSRGNTHSRKHVSLDPEKDSKFWDYSYHEMGYYDLPASIDYILNATGYSKLTYVGMSQGVTQLLVMGSERPEYNEKIVLACALAPVTNMYNVTNVLMNSIRIHSGLFDFLVNTFRLHRMMEINDPLIVVFNAIGLSNKMFMRLFIKKFGMQYLLGASDNIDEDDLPLMVAHWPSTVSIKQARHYTQGGATGIFGPFDYGKAKNLEIYKTETPTYDLTKITMPFAAYYSKHDAFINNKVLEETLLQMPNVVEKYVISDDSFNHIDFIASNDVFRLVYDKIIKDVDFYNNKTKIQ